MDKLQNKYDDIIFVIAGTNDNDNTLKKYIGEPADSINSLVVNSVDDKGKRSNFSRKGPVLSFFYKPDLSYYGENIKAFNGYNENFDIVSGTSFSAP
ncbi:MAG: S8 family serine peptidase [Bacilli bacterium]|nr:S8 family serine peptidase [Bacilli bacterium]